MRTLNGTRSGEAADVPRVGRRRRGPPSTATWRPSRHWTGVTVRSATRRPSLAIRRTPSRCGRGRRSVPIHGCCEVSKTSQHADSKGFTIDRQWQLGPRVITCQSPVSNLFYLPPIRAYFQMSLFLFRRGLASHNLTWEIKTTTCPGVNAQSRGTTPRLFSFSRKDLRSAACLAHVSLPRK